MIVLGVHYETHDTGAALVRDGEIVAAIAEERLSRAKHDKSAPVRSIRACLEMAGIGARDVDVLALSGYGWPQNWYRYLTSEIHQFRWAWGPFFPFRRNPYKLLGLRRLKRSRSKLRRIREALHGFGGAQRRYAHEHLHVTGAYWTSGMTDPVIVVAEGSGWDRTCTVALRDGSGWRDVAFTLWPHSPGQFYDCVTTLAGFRAPWHAGKITGLAAYGDPSRCRALVRPLLSHEDLRLRADPAILRWPHIKKSAGTLPPELREFSREDLSAAFQERLEEVLVDLVATAVEKTGKRQVALAGGTFANVKLNQRILALDGVDEVFVHPGMTDTGLALGAALEAYAEADPSFAPTRLDNVYLGPRYDAGAIQAALERAGLSHERYEGSIEEVVAQKLAAGAVVGRFAGRMEYGPRALGNRSVLYTPSDPSVNDWLNERLDRNEFMPFAPAVPFEDRHRLFTGLEGAEYTAEFMTITCDCTDDARRLAPAIVHVDGTARPHLVRAEANPSFHRILKEFDKRTGIPCLVNTSFNMHEEPIVCSPDDAISALLRSRLDFLAIEDFLVPLPAELHVEKPAAAKRV